MDLIHGSPFSQRLIHDKVAVAGRNSQAAEQLVSCQVIIIFGESQAVTSGFQAAYSFLKGFFVSFSNAHYFTHSPHLCAKFVLHAFKLFKGPAGKFNNHIIPVRHIFIQSAVFSAGDILQCEPGREHGGYKGDGEAGGFRGQSGGAGGSWIDLDYNDAVADRVVGKLNICASNDLNRFYDAVSLFLKPFLHFFRYGQHGSGTEGIAGVHAHGVNIFDKADSDHIVVRIPDDLQFQLFPPQDRLLNKHLSYKAGLEPSCADGFQFFSVVDQSAACASHCVCRTENNRIAQLLCNIQRFFHTVGYLAPCHFNADGIHGLFKFDPVLASFNGVYLDSDHLNIVFVKYAFFRKFRAQVQAGLPPEVRQKGIGAFFCDDLFQTCGVERLDIGYIRGLGIRHYRGGI